jgi:hypothetical protein
MMGYIENALVQGCATWMFVLTLSALPNPAHAQKNPSESSLNEKPNSSAALLRVNEAAGGGSSKSFAEATADKRLLGRANGTVGGNSVKPLDAIDELRQLLAKTACVGAGELALRKSFPCPATECVRAKAESGFCKTRAFITRLSSLSYGILPFDFAAQTTKAPVRMEGMSRLWQWATRDQTALRVLAIDARRQEAVAKIGEGGELIVLRPGMQAPTMAVQLTALSGSTATFQPMNLEGRETIDRIEIALSGGGQVTTVVSLAAPPRSVASVWGVVRQQTVKR